MSILTKLAASAYRPDAFSAFTAKTDFTLGTARAMIWLSQLAYETGDPRKVTSILETWDLSPFPGGPISTPAISPLPIARSQAILARGAEAALLAFGGTDPLVVADWVADFDIAPRDGTTQGFAQAVATALPAIRQRLAGSTAPIVVTGHSLGGALAVLAARHLAEEGLPVAAVYTFGMPRPGSADWARDYDQRLGTATYRLVLGEDIVPTVAPSGLGFHHVGRLLRQARGARFRAQDLAAAPGSDAPPFGTPPVHSILGWPHAFFGGAAAADGGGHDPTWSGRPELVRRMISLLPGSIRDHLPDSYIAALDPP